MVLGGRHPIADIATAKFKTTSARGELIQPHGSMVPPGYSWTSSYLHCIAIPELCLALLQIGPKSLELENPVGNNE